MNTPRPTVRNCRIAVMAALATMAVLTTSAADQRPDGGPLSVREIRDIAYASGPGYGEDKGALDLYLPPDRTGFPVMIFWHGGGLKTGDKAAQDDLARHFARTGFGVVSPNYRLSPDVMYPAHVQDAASAFRWVHDHIAEHGGDPDRIFISGHSAGGYLAALMTLDSRYLEAEGLATGNIRGCIPVSGMFDVARAAAQRIGEVWPADPAVVKAASPITYVGRKTPPILLLYGDHDAPGRGEQTRDIYQAMRDAGHTSVEIHEIADRTHRAMRTSLATEGDEAFELMVAFMLAHGAGGASE